MNIADAQREMRMRFVGGFYGQLVSGVLWLVAAALAQWVGPRASITTALLGGFFIFAVTELLLRLTGAKPLSPENTLHSLGMQVAFVLPLSMPLLLPVGLFRLNWFYPALTVLLGAHYLPFAFLYGMPMFWALGCGLVSAGFLIARFRDGSFSLAAWVTGIVLVVFALIGRAIVRRESLVARP